MAIEFFEDTPAYRDHFLNDVPYPVLTMLETSSLCNLRCPFCPRTMGKSPSAGKSGKEFGNMKMDLLDRLDSLFRNTGSVVLSWFGEPLVNKQLPTVIRRLKSYDVHTHVTSNAMLLKEKVAIELVEAGLDAMAISMDAADPETFRYLREGAELETVKANIQTLNRIKKRLGSRTPFLQIAFVAMPQNIDQLPDMVRLVDELGIRQFTIGPLDDFALTGNFDFELPSEGAMGQRERARKAFQEAKDLADKLGIGIGLESPLRFYHELGGETPPEFAVEERFFRNDYTLEQTAALGLRKGCGVPFLHTVIGYDGNVHPCCVSSTVLGNVYENTFEEIWWGPKYRAFRASLKSTNPPTECKNCRRAIWNGSHPVDDVRDYMRVGEHEVHGFGWGASVQNGHGPAYRQMERDSTFFLRYSGQPHLAMELGTLQPQVVTGQVVVNDVEVGSFRVRPGWHRFDFPLPALEGDFVKVKVISQPYSPHLLIRNAALRHRDERALWDRLRESSPLIYPLEKLDVGLRYAAKGTDLVTQRVRRRMATSR